MINYADQEGGGNGGGHVSEAGPHVV